MESETCLVCGQGRKEHDSPEIHHLFNDRDGQLHAKPVDKPRPANAREHIVAPADEPCATRLVATLHSKGLIDDEDLVWVLTGGKRPDGSDNAARHGDSGDLRDRAVQKPG